MPIVRKNSLPIIIKAPIRLTLFMFWKIRHVLDRMKSKQYKHIITCGYPRGGTSLLYNMLSTSLDGFSFDEFETRVVERLHRYGNYATKTPMDIFDLGELDGLNKFNKDICVLIVLRDIRDILTSRHPNVPGEYFIGYDHSWWPKDEAFIEWEYTAPGIGEIHQAINGSYLKQGIRILKVRYEDVVTAPDEMQAELELFLGLKFSRAIKDFNKNKSMMAYQYEGEYKAKDQSLVMEDKPLVSSRIGKWRETKYRDRIIEQFTKYPELFDVLVREGYESDNSWFNEYTV